MKTNESYPTSSRNYFLRNYFFQNYFMKFYVKLDAFKTGIYSLAWKLIWFSGQRKQSESCTYFVQELIFLDLLTELFLFSGIILSSLKCLFVQKEKSIRVISKPNFEQIKDRGD